MSVMNAGPCGHNGSNISAISGFVQQASLINLDRSAGRILPCSFHVNVYMVLGFFRASRPIMDGAL
jgi:hypothetical protein